MLLSDMDRKTLAITPPLLLLSSFFFHLRGAAFGSSKAFHCLMLLSCLLLSSVNTLHNLADYDSLGSNIAERFQSFNGGGSVAVQNVCPSSNLLFSLLPGLGSEHQFDPLVTFFSPSSCPGKSWSSSSALKSNNNLSGVVWLSLKPVHIIEFQPFTGFSRIGGGTTPLSKELFAKKKNTRELSISVSGKQCEGLSSEQVDSIKFLFFYQTGLTCASGVAVFAVPMKSTAPVLMLSLCKKPVSWWLRAKKLSIALLIAVALLVLIFCFNDHFTEERNNIAVGKGEKPSTVTISLEMDTLLRSISKETLQVSNEVVSENSVKPVSSSCGGGGETSELTVKTAKDKKRRRNKKKKKGAVSELTTTDVSSSQSGNSTPRSPMSPEPPAAVVVVTQAATKPTTTTPKPVLSHSATFPVSGTKSMMISSLAPNARAPGPKSRSEVKEEEEYRCYDIWGDHLTGLHLMDRFKEVREGRSSSCFGEEDEFVSLFVKGPHHNLLPGSHAKTIYGERRMMKLVLVVAISFAFLLSLFDSSRESLKHGESMLTVHFPEFHLIPTTGASGPESFVFDISGDGPYTGLSDGRIVKWIANESRWIDFAVTTPARDGCEGPHEHQRTEHECGRPLGLAFEKSTGDLFIADAYMGLLKVGREGGLANQVLTDQLDKPLTFTNSVEIDPQTGVIYFTDSSTVYQRRNYIGVIMNGDRTGRLMKYDPSTKQVTTLLSNLAFANGIVLSQNGDYLLVAETATSRILRYWLNDTSVSESHENYEVFAEQLPGFPDNIKRSPRGGFWVGLNTKHSKLTEFAMSNAWLGRAALGLPVDWMKVHSYWAKYKGNGMAVRLSEGSGVISEVFEGTNGNKWISISEVEERDGTLWVGSVNTPFAGVYKI